MANKHTEKKNLFSKLTACTCVTCLENLTLRVYSHGTWALTPALKFALTFAKNTLISIAVFRPTLRFKITWALEGSKSVNASVNANDRCKHSFNPQVPRFNIDIIFSVRVTGGRRYFGFDVFHCFITKFDKDANFFGYFHNRKRVLGI